MNIPVTLAVEGLLDETVLKRLLSLSEHQFHCAPTLGFRGRAYLQSRINNLNNAAQGHPYIVLADLDRDECAPDLIRSWFVSQRHPNLILRFAVREVEAWLLADRHGIADFLGVAIGRIPVDAESVDNPKQLLVNTARYSRKRIVRDDLVPDARTGATIGPNYPGRLAQFVQSRWDPLQACARSNSLERAIHSIQRFVPHS